MSTDGVGTSGISRSNCLINKSRTQERKFSMTI